MTRRCVCPLLLAVAALVIVWKLPVVPYVILIAIQTMIAVLIIMAVLAIVFGFVYNYVQRKR